MTDKGGTGLVKFKVRYISPTPQEHVPMPNPKPTPNLTIIINPSPKPNPTYIHTGWPKNGTFFCTP